MTALMTTLPLLLVVSLATSCATARKVDYVDLVTGGRDGWQHPEEVVDALGLAPGDRVAEIGAGDGYWLPWLSQAVGPSGRVYAVEVEGDLVADLEARVRRDGLANVTVVLGGYHDPKLPDGSIDLAMTCLTYHHIEDRDAYFRRLRIDLTRRGRVAHLDDRPDAPAPFRWFQGEGHWIDPEVVRGEMERAGYRRVAVHDFLPVQSFQVFAPEAAVVRRGGHGRREGGHGRRGGALGSSAVARRIPENRFDELVDAATEVFIARGYRLTQMADVAEAVGVAKGTLYGYVESKEALFALCLFHADRSGMMARPEVLPVPTPRRGELAAAVKQVLSEQSVPTRLAEAVARERADDARAELEGVVRELYETLERFHKGIKLLDRCTDHPELGEVWQRMGREGPRAALVRYLERRMAAGQLRRVANVRLAARMVIEVCSTWAIHIKWDRAPEDFDPDEARENAVDFLVTGLALPGA